VILLGLDVSTTAVGCCIIDTGLPSRDRLLNAYAIVLSKKNGLYSKADHVRDEFLQLKREFSIDRVMVEENLQAFRRGLSSAKTLSTLAKFNGIVSFLAQDVLGVPVELINVNSARAKVEIKVDRKIDVDAKQQVLNAISGRAEFEGYKWPTKTLKSGPRKGMTINAPECFDIADAAVICLSGLSIEH